MKKKKTIIPKIDLSSRVTEGHLSSDIEQIILQALIAFNGDITRVKKHFNLTESEAVDSVYIKYFVQITKAVEAKTKTTETDNSINIICQMFSDHIEGARDMMTSKDTKLMSDKLVRNLNSVLDRLVTIKENNARTYDTVINKLNENLIKAKNLELVEKGKVEDTSTYDENVKTVSDRINEYLQTHQLERGDNSKKIRVINVKTQEETIFKSITECCKFFGIECISNIYQMINQKSPYKGTYIVQYVEEGK